MEIIHGYTGSGICLSIPEKFLNVPEYVEMCVNMPKFA